MPVLTLKPNGQIYFSWRALYRHFETEKKSEETKMTLEEAIKYLHIMREEQVYLLTPDGDHAIDLALEALKRVKWHKEQHISEYYEPLPGETKGD